MNGADLQACIGQALLPHPPERLGVAVSGGSDSVALLHLAAQFCAGHPTTLHVVTVDHKLRREAAAEARGVGEACKHLGVSHDILEWKSPQEPGNLQANARQARYRLMTDWARARQIENIALGHTADDQAETVLLRLARRAGVDGLSAMQPRRIDHGIAWLRPLLGVRREVLRTYLRDEGIEWAEDPGNDDLTYDRIKARRALETLAGLGIEVESLADVARNMRGARTALDWHAFTAAREIALVDAGAMVLCDRRLRILPEEIQRRILLRAISWINGSVYPPRRAAMLQLMQSLKDGQAATLDGCHARCVKGRIWIFREFDAVRNLAAGQSDAWDGRWRFLPVRPKAVPETATVRALGEDGLAQCPDWRETGRPFEMLLSTPSLWEKDQLIAAPAAGMGEKWHAHLDEGAESFYSGLLSH